MLKETTIDLGIKGWDEYYSYGMVNANVVCTVIYVPDDYKTIQDAVNATSSGNTIIVRDGVYTENIDVNKRLTIRSENGPANCIVQAVNPDDHVFEVTADYVDISGFTVKDATGSGTFLSERWTCSLTAGCRKYYVEVKVKAAGIRLKADYCNISNNKYTSNNWAGIRLFSSSNNRIISNTANSNGYHGILLQSSSNNMLLNNTISSNSGVGIFLHNSSNNNEIRKNTALDDLIGLYLNFSSNNKIINNSVYSNRMEGIRLESSSNNILTDNIANSNDYHGIILLSSSNYNAVKNNNVNFNNNYGIYLESSSKNKIYFNNFINNTDSVYSFWSTNVWNTTSPIAYTYKGSKYTNYLGNYWSDYTGSDSDGDGIGDTPYSINSDKDDYPLMQPFENYI